MSTKLARSLFPKVRAAVLGVTHGNPREEYYLRDLVRRTGLGVGHVQRELARLTQAGVLRRVERGIHVFFQADSDCPIFAELRGIVAKTIGVLPTLQRALEPVRSRIQVAFLYGSVARGQEGRESDIDLMVIGRVAFSDTVACIRPLENRLRREINPTVYAPGEFRSKLAKGSHFLVSVMKEPKLFLVGGEDELGTLARKRLADKA